MNIDKLDIDFIHARKESERAADDLY